MITLSGCILKRRVRKKLTLNAAFKQVFGEKLVSMGFKFIGGRSFVRVIDDEVIQTVSCVKGSPLGAYGLDERSDVIYRIWFAISTVYDDEMLFKPNRCQTGFKGKAIHNQIGAVSKNYLY